MSVQIAKHEMLPRMTVIFSVLLSSPSAEWFPGDDSIGQGYDFDDVTRRWVLVLNKGHGTGKLKLKYSHMSTVTFLDEDKDVALAYQARANA